MQKKSLNALAWLDPIVVFAVQPFLAGLAIVSLSNSPLLPVVLKNPMLSWVWIAILQLIFAEDIWSFSVRQNGQRKLGIAWVKLAGAGICGILVFAAAYQNLGLIDQGRMSHDAATAIYFSITAWSTVGYGDVLPSLEARPLAALQALIGVVYDSAVIGLIVFASTQKQTSERSLES